MVRLDSYWIKVPVTSVLIVVIAWMFAYMHPSSEKAVTTMGAILLLIGYVLGLDTTIIKRIVGMKPLSGIINGLYWTVLGLLYLVIMATSGGFDAVQLVFLVFVCALGFTILIYQIRKGALSKLRKREDPKVQKKGLKEMLRRHSVYTYFSSIGADIGVTALFFSVFVIINYAAGFLYFFLGFFIHWVGTYMASKVGAVKEGLPVEEG